MIIDFRVRAPFEAYSGTNLFKTTEFGEFNTKVRVGVSRSESAKNFSMQQLLQEAEAAGIDRLVVPVRKAVNGKNEDLVRLLATYPDKLIGLSGIEVVNIAEAIAEIEKFVVNGPCRGITLEPGQDKTPWLINSPWVYPLYDYCQEKNVPICFTYGGIMVRSLRFYLPDLLDDVAAAFPRLRMALAHGGWPYVTECCQIAVNRGNVYLVPDIYMIKSPGMQDYITAANYLLRNRVIFASAYPLLPLREAKEAYMDCLIPEARPLVMGENAINFLAL